MSCETNTTARLRGTGHRITPQRLLILSAIRHSNGHVTVSQIENKVRQLYPTIDISTVYRNLTTLRGLRLISETKIGGEESQYEWIDQQRHHHIFCRRCSSVVQIDDTYLKSLSDSLLNDYEFTLDTDHFAIPGMCSSCSASSEETEKS